MENLSLYSGGQQRNYAPNHIVSQYSHLPVYFCKWNIEVLIWTMELEYYFMTTSFGLLLLISFLAILASSNPLIGSNCVCLGSAYDFSSYSIWESCEVPNSENDANLVLSDLSFLSIFTSHVNGLCGINFKSRL